MFDLLTLITEVQNGLFGISYNFWNTLGVLSSFFVALITLFALLYTIIFNQKLLKENNKAIDEANRANLSVYSSPLIASNNNFYIVVRNFGRTTAIIKSIKIDDQTRESIKLDNKDFINYLINLPIAPNQSITHLVQSINIPKDLDSKIEIIYTSASNNKDYTCFYKGKIDSAHKLPSIGISEGSHIDTHAKLLHIVKKFVELYQDDLRRKL